MSGPGFSVGTSALLFSSPCWSPLLTVVTYCVSLTRVVWCAQGQAQLITEAQSSHVVSYVVGAADKLGLSLGLYKHHNTHLGKHHPGSDEYLGNLTVSSLVIYF